MDLHALRASARGKLQRAMREVLDQYASEQEERELRRNEGLVRELGLVRAEVAALGSALTEFEVRARRDLHFAAEVSAAAESAAFTKAHLPEAPTFPHPDETLRHAAGLVAVPGLALEFGVGGGHTLRLMAENLPGHRVVGFDVFTGLPENWRTGFPAGAFAQEELPEVAGAELVVGLFDETLPGFLDDNDEPVAFLHLDADLYSSTKTVLELLGHRLVAGSVVLFDEYFNYPGWQQGEHRAWEEASGLTFRYEGYTYNHEQLIVVVTGQPSPAAAASSTSTLPA
jgi:predicted O-methyltransferase YrrM